MLVKCIVKNENILIVVINIIKYSFFNYVSCKNNQNGMQI